MKIRKLANYILYCIIAVLSILLVCCAGSDNFNIVFFIVDLAVLAFFIFILKNTRR